MTEQQKKTLVEAALVLLDLAYMPRAKWRRQCEHLSDQLSMMAQYYDTELTELPPPQEP